MKLYRYYKIPIEDNSSIYDDLTVDEKYPLYAFTTDKQFDKQFIHERDMKKFIRFVSHVDEEAYPVPTTSGPQIRMISLSLVEVGSTLSVAFWL